MGILNEATYIIVLVKGFNEARDIETAAHDF